MKIHNFIKDSIGMEENEKAQRELIMKSEESKKKESAAEKSKKKEKKEQTEQVTEDSVSDGESCK